MKRKQSKTRPQSSCSCLGFSAETLLSKCVELTELSLPPLPITHTSQTGVLTGSWLAASQPNCFPLMS